MCNLLIPKTVVKKGLPSVRTWEVYQGKSNKCTYSANNEIGKGVWINKKSVEYRTMVWGILTMVGRKYITYLE